MKIAFFHNVPPGGAQRVVYEQIKELSKKYTITLFRIKNKDNVFLDFTKLPCNIKEYSFSPEGTLPGFLSRLQKDYKKYVLLKAVHKTIAKDIDTNNFALAIVHPDQLTQAPFLLQFLKTKNIYYCEEWLRIAYEKELQLHNLAFPNAVYNFFITNLLKKIDKKNACSASTIIANSTYTAQCIESAYGRKSPVIHPGVSTHLFKKSARTIQQVLFIGSPDEPLNGYALLKTITPSLLRMGIKVKIIDLFAHPLSERKLIEAYSSSLAIICLSTHEPFGLVPLESLSCETPVIAVQEGGYMETVINNKTGYLIHRNANELFEKIVLLAKNKKLRETFGKNGRQHVKNNFSWEKHIKLLENFLYDKKEEKRLLSLATAILKKGKNIYLPSKFWQVYAKKNSEQLRKDGFENIKIRQGLNYFNFLVFEWNYWQFQYVWKRSNWKTKISALPTALTSPRYPHFPMEERQRWLFVYYHCLLWDYVKKYDYKNLLALEEPLFGNPLLVRWRGRTFTQDLLNSILETYAMLEALQTIKKDPKVILEVGGGYGRNAYVLKHLFPKSTIIMVDIVPGIILAQWYLSRVFPGKTVLGIAAYKDFSKIKPQFKKADFIFLLPHQIELLPEKSIDLFININSFHEMTFEQLNVYFHSINRLTHGIFYMKQWKEQNNEFDDIRINEYDYPVFPSWEKLFHREARVQSKFFESAYFIAGKPKATL